MALLGQGRSHGHRASFHDACDRFMSISEPPPGKSIVEFASPKFKNGGVLRLTSFGRTPTDVQVGRLSCWIRTGAESSRSFEADALSNPTHKQDKSSLDSSIITEDVEGERDNSLDSIEGLATDWRERGMDNSRDSIEGLAMEPREKGNVSNSRSDRGGDGRPVLKENNSEWKNVFPSYMRSKENEVAQESEDEGCSETVPNGPAAAAAVASAKEFDSKFGSTLPVLVSAHSKRPTEEGKLKDLISHDPIWAAIRAEARLEAEREPLLSSFLYASILAHSCFERSLGFVLANRLENATLLATQLLDVFDGVLMNDVCIRQAVRLDVQAVKDRDPSCISYSLALLYLKGYHAVQAHRIAHALWNRGQKILALALQSRISEVFAVDIHPAASIGKAVLLDHGTGVVIGETAVVGDRVSMLQGVTLGGTGKEAGDRHPKIREGVLIGAGATILGNIVVGRGAMVAAGSLVLKDVPPHSMVAGTPAKVVGFLEESVPSLTMKQDAPKEFCQEGLLESGFDGGAGI